MVYFFASNKVAPFNSPLAILLAILLQADFSAQQLVALAEHDFSHDAPSPACNAGTATKAAKVTHAMIFFIMVLVNSVIW